MAATYFQNKNVGDKVYVNIDGAPREFVVVQRGSAGRKYGLMVDVYKTIAYSVATNLQSRYGVGLDEKDSGTSNIAQFFSVDSKLSGKINLNYVRSTIGGGSVSNSLIYLYDYDIPSNYRVPKFSGQPIEWWTGRVYYNQAATYSHITYVNTTGTTSMVITNVGAWPCGLRPCINFDNSLLFENDGTVRFPPNAPPIITVRSSTPNPNTIYGGVPVDIAWSTVLNPYFTIDKYTLQRRAMINGTWSAWSEIYSGILTNYKDGGLSATATKVQYSVRAVSTGSGANGADLISDGQTTAELSVTTIRPSVPASLDAPEFVVRDGYVTVSWGISTTTLPGSSITGYILERAYNGSNIWKTIPSAAIISSSQFSVTYIENGEPSLKSVAYRVKAFDIYNIDGAYKESAFIPLITNDPPVISGSDGDLGLITSVFSFSYSVRDNNDWEPIKIEEYFNGTLKRVYNTTNDVLQNFILTQSEFILLPNRTSANPHIITITAIGRYGAFATQIYKFTKNESQIVVYKEFPVPDFDIDIPERIFINVSRTFPTGAVFKVFACNNGNDENPAWENCTSAVVGGQNYYFINSVKTASKWGVNVRVELNRNNANGECWVDRIWGDFE